MISVKEQLYYNLNNDVSIPSLAFGTWQVEDGKVAVTSIKEALRVGYRHIDTAMMYGNEESVGKAVKLSEVPREDIFITSKLANVIRGYDETIKAVNESLDKMETDYLDLYLIHWPNPVKYRKQWKKANAESWRALEDLYKARKLRSIGISNFQPHHIDALLETATVKPMVNQIRLCPGEEPMETIQYCKDKNMLIEAYSPLGKGRIFEDEVLKGLADKYNKSTSQISLRWSLQKGYLPLPKSVTPSRIKENFDVFDFEIEPEDMDIITNLESCFEGPILPDETNF